MGQAENSRENEIKVKLDTTRNLLHELGNGVSQLVNSSSNIFNDEGIQTHINEFRQVYEEAVRRLEKPTFRIATIGTTSSGKSTIVNALIGRRIAPIESGEMSAGVLTLRHSEEYRLTIEKTEAAIWDTGKWAELSDQDFYERIRSAMYTYHEVRKKRDYIAPQIIADVPLLPACDPSLLSLPAGIGIELIDLPGLKSVQDRTNLAIIQPQVGRSFSLVALDYMQVDDQHRKQLLEELKRVVEFLQGRTDCMIFILNRVDQRGTDDLPLEQRVSQLQAEIQAVLSLPEVPDVIPFSARLLYHAQCAWGAGDLNASSTVEPQVQLQRLQAMFEDCAGIIKTNVKGSRELKYWFRNVEDQVVEDQEPVDDETLREIVRYARQWSGGEALWNCMASRIQESFSELVLLPALMDVFENYHAFSEVIDLAIQTQMITNQEEVEKERNKLRGCQQDLRRFLDSIKKELTKEIKEYVEGLKSSNDLQIRLQTIKNARERGRQGFQIIFDTVNELEKDLTRVIIGPIRDALRNNQGTYELEDTLKNNLPPSFANNIAREYDHVSRILPLFEKESDSLVRQVRADSSQDVKQLKHNERHVRLLYYTVKEALKMKAEFFLQVRSQNFLEGLRSLIDEELIKRLENYLTNFEFLSLDIESAIVTVFEKNLAKTSLSLPESLFEINPKIDQDSQTKQEITGSRTETYTTGSCLGKKTKTRIVDVKSNVEYEVLYIPNIDTMAKQWASGIEQGKDQVWDILCQWMIQRLDEVSDAIQESSDEIINLANVLLDKQLRIIEGDFEEQKKLLDKIKIQKSDVDACFHKLENNLKTTGKFLMI